jgi:hypothetical protein
MKNLYNLCFFNELFVGKSTVAAVGAICSCLSPSLSQISFTLCSVVINVMFNTVKPLSIISERMTKNKWMWEDKRCGKVFFFFFQIIWGELYENYHHRADSYFKL